ncbi:MAG: hypothetical protein Q4G25_03105 [Paracoccus sp. (in: a-proteobacteria)]|nr:hypothetical protein [Paracoccus sp. (in: a-proteobacteria)]
MNERANLPANPGSGRQAGEAVGKCVGTLVVNVHWGNDQDDSAPYMKDSRIRVGGEVAIVLQGPAERTEIVTTGTHTFKDLPCGTYQIGVAVLRNNPLVDKALKHVGMSRWSYANSIDSLDGKLSLPRNTNKCNFFIYDMVQQTYGQAPVYSYARGASWSPIRKTVPALAESWARSDNTATDPTPGWRNIGYKFSGGTPVPPGAILGIAARYADASGHVGIISYPDDVGVVALLAGGQVTVPVIMPGKTISAAEDVVRHNNWGFRTSRNKETSSLNAPAAGVEVLK